MWLWLFDDRSGCGYIQGVAAVPFSFRLTYMPVFGDRKNHLHEYPSHCYTLKRDNFIHLTQATRRHITSRVFDGL